jgi:hypothetical protein
LRDGIFLFEGALMKKCDHRFTRSGYKGAVLSILLACAVASCGKSRDRPVPPKAPPKPQAESDISSSDVHNAVFTYTSPAARSAQSGLSATIRSHMSSI